MPPKGRIDRLLIFYSYTQLDFFCEATDIRGEYARRYKIESLGQNERLWVIMMDRERDKERTIYEDIRWDKGGLGNFIWEAMNDPRIERHTLIKFMNANFHSYKESKLFEKISP
jgi:hypothetical protein